MNRGHSISRARRPDAAIHALAGRINVMASNVDLAEDARFKFQIIQPVLNDVACADDIEDASCEYTL